jgi:hypothetical protein
MFCLHENGILVFVFDPDRFEVLQQIIAHVPRDRLLIAGGGDRMYYGRGTTYDPRDSSAPLQVHFLLSI